ncbi:MAG: hypothetical protein WC816_15505 [Sphingomonas sp.]|jgi:hypothetical protein
MTRHRSSSTETARRRTLALLLPLSLLAGCGPKLEALAILKRVVAITNKDTRNLTLTRVTANGLDSDPHCNAYPGTTLAPGESYQTAFFLCSDVSSLRVETDAGTAYLGT